MIDSYPNDNVVIAFLENACIFCFGSDFTIIIYRTNFSEAINK